MTEELSAEKAQHICLSPSHCKYHCIRVSGMILLFDRQQVPILLQCQSYVLVKNTSEKGSRKAAADVLCTASTQMYARAL